MLAREDLNIHDEPAVERDDEPDARAVQVEPADDRRGAAFQDPEDAPFRAIVADALDPGDDAIPVHRLVEIAPGDVQISLDLFQRAVRHDEPEPPRMGDHAADDQVHAVGQPVAVAAGLDERSAFDEVGQELLEGGPLVARELQALEQLTGGRGMVDFVADQLQELLMIQHSDDSTRDVSNTAILCQLYSNRTPCG